MWTGGRSQAEMERALLQGEREAERALLQQEQRAADQLQEKLVALETGVQKERDKVTTPGQARGRGPGLGEKEERLSGAPHPLLHPLTCRPGGLGVASGEGPCPPRKVAARRSPRAGPVTLVWGPLCLGLCAVPGCLPFWALLGSTPTPAGTVSTAEGLVLGAMQAGVPVEKGSGLGVQEVVSGASPRVSAPLSLQGLQLRPCPSQGQCPPAGTIPSRGRGQPHPGGPTMCQSSQVERGHLFLD